MDRWTIFVCSGCGGATGRHQQCDAKREAVEVIPAERMREAVEALGDLVDASGGVTQVRNGDAAERWSEALARARDLVAS